MEYKAPQRRAYALQANYIAKVDGYRTDDALMLEISQHTSAACPEARFTSEKRRPSAAIGLDVGLINNMPDSALKGTESQFLSLLEAAAGSEVRIRVHLFAMREVPRGEDALIHMRGRYIEADRIACSKMDALIVTGNEPRAASLKEERHWKSLAALADFAAERSIPTIWSCLAAHAAVLHFDGVERRRIGRKRFGLFECEGAAAHRLLNGVAARFVMPHSRHNEVDEKDLLRAGYEILSRSREAGVDTFVKSFGRCDFIFFQGHPEYASDTLLREYRRDVTRYRSGDQDVYPTIPRNCLDASQEERLAHIARRSMADRGATPITEVLEATQSTASTAGWRDDAATIYRNWLASVVEMKQMRADGRMSLPA